MINARIKELGDKKEGTWKEIANTINEEFNTSLTDNAVRKRYDSYKPENDLDTDLKEFKTIYGDGTIEARKIVNLNSKQKDNPEEVLKVLGYNPIEWEMISMTFSTWEQHTKMQETKQLCSVRFKIKPKRKGELSLEETVKLVKDVFKKEIKPLTIEPKDELIGLDPNKMMELGGVELHLGKLAWNGDAGQDYDQHIAQERFTKIIEETIDEQDKNQCDTLFICIGEDFFNSDNAFYTTTKGTPQPTTDIRWKKMFLIGLKLWSEAIKELEKHFNKINIQLSQGNHDSTTSFYLFIALEQAFANDKQIDFKRDLKETQCLVWGKCAIFTNHGDCDLKRLIKSIPAEFPKEWGDTIYRELHLHHLHKEVVVDDDSGMITRRLTSPTGTDEWHYSNRYIGASQRQQIFIWDKNEGLKSCRYITFDNKSLKKK